LRPNSSAALWRVWSRRFRTPQSVGASPKANFTIFYRFSQPGEAAPLVVASTDPADQAGADCLRSLQTIGDHLLRRRLGAEVDSTASSRATGCRSNEPAKLGSESVQTDSAVHAGHHPVPKLQPTAARHHVGRAVGFLPDGDGDYARGVRSSDWRRPGHPRPVGTRGARTGRRVRGAGGVIPSGSRN